MTAYVAWYFAAGVLAFSLFYVFVARKRARENAKLCAGFAADGTGHKSLLDKSLNWFLFPLIALAIFLAIWPWVLWIEARGALAGKNDHAENTRPEFEVRDEFLICELTLEDIECWETVEDPLGAAPRVPFGHMNPAWKAFKARGVNGAIWKFSGKHVSDWGTDWLREGYAVLKEDGSRPYFLTRVEYLEKTTRSECACSDH